MIIVFLTTLITCSINPETALTFTCGLLTKLISFAVLAKEWLHSVFKVC